MLPLISAGEREDLIISSDSALMLAKEDRVPVRAIPKKDCELNGTPATVWTVRPLLSREMIRVINAATGSATDAFVVAVEIACCSISDAVTECGQVKSAGTPKEVYDLIGELPHSAVLAVGNWLIDQSSLSEDPEEPTE